MSNLIPKREYVGVGINHMVAFVYANIVIFDPTANPGLYFLWVGLPLVWGLWAEWSLKPKKRYLVRKWLEHSVPGFSSPVLLTERRYRSRRLAKRAMDQAFESRSDGRSITYGTLQEQNSL